MQPVIDLLSSFGPWGPVVGIVAVIAIQWLHAKFPNLQLPNLPSTPAAPVASATAPADPLLVALKGALVSKAGAGADPVKVWNSFVAAQLAAIHAPATTAPQATA